MASSGLLALAPWSPLFCLLVHFSTFSWIEYEVGVVPCLVILTTFSKYDCSYLMPCPCYHSAGLTILQVFMFLYHLAGLTILQVEMVMGLGPCWTRPFFKGLGLNFLDPSDPGDRNLDPKKYFFNILLSDF